MNEAVGWRIDFTAIEWFVVLGAIVFLAILGAVLKRRSKNAKLSLVKNSQLTKTSESDWHSKSSSSALELLGTSSEGLSEQQIVERLNQYGLNKLPEKRNHGALIRFLYQFHNVLIYVLLASCVVTAVLGHWVDSSVIFAVVILNAVIGFLQEGKAENSLRAIRKMLSQHAMVIRNGEQMTISAESLLPGDMVLLQSGDKVPADLRLVDIKGLQIQESALTGESMAVEKDNQSVVQQTALADRTCMAFSGTLVTHGKGTGVVVATGSQTELGRISSLVSEVSSVTTPLLVQMTQFGRWLTLAILIIAVLTFAFGTLLRDYSVTQMFLASVSLVVAAIPEGLPAIMTITLAIGVQRMARRNAIIRKLPAVETLGAVSVICTDKTGTLTRNEMTVQTIVTTENCFALTGVGYHPNGEILVSGQKIIPKQHQTLQQLIRAAALCNDSTLEKTNSEWHVHGDPMEGALLIAGLKAGADIDAEVKQYPRIDHIPFESEHRFMATLHHSSNGDAFIFLKGAPEVVLAICERQTTNADNTPLDKKFWLDIIEKFTGQGQRVLAFAMKSVAPDTKTLNFNDVKDGLVMLGMSGLIDPPREEAVKAVQACKNAGIRVKMITGDHGGTAAAIARQLQLVNVKDVLIGEQLDSMSEDELRQRVLEVDIYARVNPEHKLLLVKLMQQQGLIVSMTGDGVNDAPALKRADVGVAMGQNGTEVAKEAAEMVLVDDNFSSISDAVEEGRTVYDNLKKSIIFILPTSGGESLIIIAAILFGFTQLPLIPVQILWVNMVTTVTLALSLSFEPAEENVMQRPPRKAFEPIISGYLVWRVIFVSVIMMVGTFGLFMWEMAQGTGIEYARTVAVNTLVMFEIFYLFNSRYLEASIFNWEGLTGNRYVLQAIAALLILQIGFTYLSSLQSLFSTTGLEASMWLKIILVSSSVFFLVEFEKYFLRKKETVDDNGS